MLAPLIVLAVLSGLDVAAASADSAADSLVVPPPPAAVAHDAVEAPCFDCTIPTNFKRGAAELLAVQLIPWSVNRFGRDAEWAYISPESWLRNLENPWKWDNNAFVNNQISHPYHGSLYYNAGRSNGYSFWQSAAWSFGGSLTWEYFAEVWAPAPNDLLNTGLGGITIGESLWRLSSLTLDDTSTGFERGLREGLATVINPVRGLNRLLDGKMNDVGPNPPDWRPSKWRWSLDAGYRNTTDRITGEPDQGGQQFIAEAELDFGDSVDDLGKSPFSFIEFFIGLGEPVGDAGILQDFRIRGNLDASTLHETEGAVHRLGGYMTYDYYAQPAFEYGAQGFQGGLISRFGDRVGLRLHTEVLGIVQPIAALQSDYFLSLEGRDYDYGLGFGGKLLARVTQQGFGFVEVAGTYVWTPIVSGFNGSHNQLQGGIEGKTYPIAGVAGVGGSLTWFHRESNYEFFPDVRTDDFQGRIFVNFSAPRWSR